MKRRYLCSLTSLLFAAAIGCDTVSPRSPDASPPDADPPDVMPMCGNGMVEFGEACDDSGESASCDSDCTGVECGDSTTNATAGELCDEGGESAECDADCTVVECGDGTANATAGEDCDDGGVSATCDDDCTVAECGDGTVNDVAGEVCDLGAANSDFSRCGLTCNWGPGLDGTFGGPGVAWETRAISGGNILALQTFHYTGMTLIRDTYAGKTYNPATNVWGTMPLPASTNLIWSDTAVSSTALYTPRDSNMWKFTFATGAWTLAHIGIPDGTSQLTAAVFDGDGLIWYKGPSNGDLVRYNPTTGATMTFPFTPSPFVDMYETRMDYDPVTNSIVYGGYTGTRFVRYDIDTGVFTLGALSPGLALKDNTCGDRSGHVYSGSNSATSMYQYDVAANTWLMLPNPPMPHDNVSTCVVSQAGWLYYATNSSWYRLALGTH